MGLPNAQRTQLDGARRGNGATHIGRSKSRMEESTRAISGQYLGPIEAREEIVMPSFMASRELWETDLAGLGIAWRLGKANQITYSGLREKGAQLRMMSMEGAFRKINPHSVHIITYS